MSEQEKTAEALEENPILGYGDWDVESSADEEEDADHIHMQQDFVESNWNEYDGFDVYDGGE